MSCNEHIALSRRRLLGGGAATLALWSLVPRAALAGGRDPRLLTIVLRGGMDGLSLVAPIGDPAYQALRGELALSRSGEGAGLPLDDMFVLNAAMPFLHSLFQQRQALIVHAVATPYRGRSHFDGQDLLESGRRDVVRSDDGWLNRALLELPAAGRIGTHKGLSIGAVVPLIMRGKAPVVSMSTQTYSMPLRDATAVRLLDLYQHTDSKLAEALSVGFEIDRVGGVQGLLMAQQARQAGPRNFAGFIDTAQSAARFFTAADGPRIGALAYDGWDTHANEGAVKGTLANRFAGLDAALKALHDGLGAAWQDTCVVVVTEFGRTARINGTAGTDHGTATVALVLGGGVKGGRVIADWPGLTTGALFEGRDLKPTQDLRRVLKGLLRDHLGLPEGILADKVFPDSRGASPLSGLLA